MQHPDEGTIHAWIDGELSADDAAALEAHLKECTECSAVAAEARGLVAASSRIVSALDIVPGDVIPNTSSKRRPWYASTQLRAAAAVMVVAGASLLVFQNGGQRKMEQAMQASAPAVSADASTQEKQLDRLESSAAVAPKPIEIAEPVPPKPAVKTAAKKKSVAVQRDEPEKALEGRVAGAVMNDAVADASKPMAPAQLNDTNALRRRFNANQNPVHNDLVVTGVSTAATSRDLRKVRTDSAKNETVYEVSPGVEVTLVDNGQPARLMLQRAAQSAAAPTAAPPPLADVLTGVAAAKAAAIDSISWTSKKGHVMKLKGPLSKGELEKIRQRLPEDQR